MTQVLMKFKIESIREILKKFEWMDYLNVKIRHREKKNELFKSFLYSTLSVVQLTVLAEIFHQSILCGKNETIKIKLLLREGWIIFAKMFEQNNFFFFFERV